MLLRGNFPRFSFYNFGIILVLLTGLLLSAHTYELTEEGIVTAVYDGDTIKVMFRQGSETVVRLIGINSPELDDPRDKIRFYALMAKRFVFYYLYNKKVKLIYDWEETDKFGRRLAYVKSDGRLFNEFIIKKGFTSVFLKYPFREDFRQRFIRAFREAREESLGLWSSEPYPVISSTEARSCVGSLKRVNFTCRQTEKKGRYLFLYSSCGLFSALIPLENLSQFPDFSSMQGCRLTVTGFIEEYYGQPQMLLFMPLQLLFDK